jgi:Transcriptional regulatory protein, C terminal
MGTRNVALLGREIEAFSEDRPRAFDSRRSGARSRETHAQVPLSSSSRQVYRNTDLDRYSHNDYRIALVPHDTRPLPHGVRVDPPATAERMLMLPFTWRELLDRVRRELNAATSPESTTARFGEVCVDFLTMEISRSQTSVMLTNQEFKLLKFFVHNPQRVLSRDELLNEVWGYNHYPSTRTVDNHVWMLRRKLELQPARPVHFLTVQRIGYRFVP